LIWDRVGQRDEYHLGIYEYATAFTLPPSYGLASALAFIPMIILLIVTVGYVRHRSGKGHCVEALAEPAGPAGRAEPARARCSSTSGR